ncbi:type I DNA topoisomerase [Limnochorda pilosa]|uniref:DNA topoisomerase 1 n=1 Tax=Limnochorda pilosa TaxID=1555112 RepID=A0A0K2SK47_LIMPI|nr:type I DNA topoisomerase [Limnochorda pilosa]BAS27491.1 DNA topoisomerase I [Limnochorda pilosa]
MAKSLVIVESPAKAKTIGRFLGRTYQVKASMGHVRDLPKSQFGVDVENGFQPRYITIRGKGKVVQELREAARKAERIYLATDPDREGEAISWHLMSALDLQEDRAQRIEFHEITADAIRHAVKNPRALDLRRVEAQQARRVLDRVVGYQLSPLLWAKVRRGLSAGRVQSVAVRLICDRQAEIDAFEPQEYWTVDVTLRALAGEEPQGPASASQGHPNGRAKRAAGLEPAVFVARVERRGGKKLEIPSESEARRVVEEVAAQETRVASVEEKERRRSPYAPYTTSTLQQDASHRLRFPASKTMRLAQQLYEGLDLGPEGHSGLITYMRTDSTQVAAQAQAEARALIEETYGAPFCPARPPKYKNRAGAQAAHEAIRPTSVRRTPDQVAPYLGRDQLRLYRLIWERFVASQMSPARYQTVSVRVGAGPYELRATGSRLLFPGFLRVYEVDEADESRAQRAPLPPLREGQLLEQVERKPEQHFTQPPPPYTEASLVKSLEELGIGRPSTYAPIIETIQKRGYVELADRKFVPTELGRVVVDLLKEYFPDIVDVEFTARMEAELDEVEEGKEDWVSLVRSFYGPFAKELEVARQKVGRVEVADEETDEVCDKCGRKMVIKHGRFGKFLACSGFPECRNTRPILEPVGVDCPECGHPLVRRRSRRGKTFYGCSNYPECRFVLWQKPVPARCPRCGSLLVEGRGRAGAGRGRGAGRPPGATEWVCPTKGCGHRQPAPSGARPEGTRARTSQEEEPELARV